ncbi:metalloregulator ArsR/SmtB family transcription factor [Solwaraspora sp. WMMD1047]|uniref:ArsR/SmtB family transcription factor n=1 Tax=Solwaraspora sp. WMMD1047 TaxID=3016102 RepID=UPI002415F71F|nr:metalloregulator ArsR/SmtB family transcription factor [Solwaraspora sp. WMMD1047]MDG4834500.1 metalloregulator ArsR/SmtB family transcription factor [Solwaraspora sp. WMMD1047]
MTTPTPTPVFAALADDTRWAILVRIGHAPASASALAEEFPISRQAIVKHLEVLRAAGLVDVERHGRELRYHPIGARLTALARDLTHLATAWDRRLSHIKSLAESTTDPAS